MSRKVLTAAFLGAIVLMSLTAASVQAEEIEWNKGDSWVYSWNATEEGMFDMDGTIEMKVGKSTSSDAYTIILSGSATASGSFMNLSFSGNVDVTGTMTRAKDTFGTISTTMIMNVSMTSGIVTMWMEMGVTTTATPPLNDLPMNQNLTPGAQFVSTSNITGTFWMNMAVLGNQTENISTTEALDLRVGSSETVTTPAGTFECIKLSTAPGPDEVTYYYSPEVKNYVKMTGSGGMEAGYAAIGDLTLESYSVGGGGIMSFITGENWWVTILIVTVVVMVILGLVLLQRKGRMPQSVPPPVQQMPPQVPPPAN